MEDQVVISDAHTHVHAGKLNPEKQREEALKEKGRLALLAAKKEKVKGKLQKKGFQYQTHTLKNYVLEK